MNADPEVEGVELMAGRLNAGAGLNVGAGTAGLVVVDDVEEASTPCLPLTMSTNERPSRFAVIDFQRRVYGAS